MERSTFVDVLPAGLQLEIYQFLYADLINKLRDTLYGISWLYGEYLYDNTKTSYRKILKIWKFRVLMP